jgi:hypothetical protein
MILLLSITILIIWWIMGVVKRDSAAQLEEAIDEKHLQEELNEIAKKHDGPNTNSIVRDSQKRYNFQDKFKGKE